MENLIFLTFATFLAIISIVDIKSKMIYDKVLIPMAAVGIFFDAAGWLVPIDEGIFCAASGFAMMYVVFKMARGGLGGGDVKFSAVLGLWLGTKIFSAIFIASVIAAVFGIFFYAKTRDAKFEIPFAPFLTIGALLTQI